MFFMTSQKTRDQQMERINKSEQNSFITSDASRKSEYQKVDSIESNQEKASERKP